MITSTPKRIYLVSCCAEKLPHAAPAQDLYRSQLFRAARAYAEQRCDLEGAEWGILSALHGLVLPDQVLEPYDQKLTGAGRDDRRAYAFRASTTLRRHGWQGAELVILAGRVYADALRDLFPELRIVEPLRGLQIGERLRWFRERALDLEAAA